MPPLDPIVSLSVALAESPGSYAFLLGSGVSRDAGVPTGTEVYDRALRELYRVENVKAEDPSADELTAWLAKTGRTDFGYSQILEEIAPDQAVRRDYLAKHFEGAEPGPTHEQLAGIAADGLVSVFVTTNFDRLLEQALAARGIQPIVVTSDAELAAVPRREHSGCFVLKPHGDYLQQTIRNTPEELAELEPEMDRELHEVFERYGVVVVGYSGNDPAISEALRARRSRYGVYWQSRSEPAPSAKALIDATGARVVRRDSAAEFLTDLSQRISVFTAQPTGLTPAVVHDEVLARVRADDRVGLDQLLRREHAAFAEGIEAQTALADQLGPPSNDKITNVHGGVMPVVERRLAGLIPVAIYEPQTFEGEVERLARYLADQPVRGGYEVWASMPRWAIWWLGLAVGGVLVSEPRWPSLRSLLQTEVPQSHGAAKPLIDVATMTGDVFGKVVIPQPDGNSNWLSPAWEHLDRTLQGCDWLRERYTEFYRGEGAPREWLARFDFLVTVAHGIAGQRAIGRWAMSSSSVKSFARRIHDDARLRAAVLDGIGVTQEQLDETSVDQLKPIQITEWSSDFGALYALKTGVED